MTPRERLEAVLSDKPVDRTPFWPKLGPTYISNRTKPFSEMSLLELYRYMDVDPIIRAERCGWEMVRSGCKITQKVDLHKEKRTITYYTPKGELIRTDTLEGSEHYFHPKEHPIKSRADLEKARYVFKNTSYRLKVGSKEAHEAYLEKIGNDGLPVIFTSGYASPLMNLLQYYIGPENTYYFLYDYPQLMDDLMAEMHVDHLRFLKTALENTKCDYIITTENTSTTLLSPSLFKRYCVLWLSEYGKLISNYGKKHIIHMCGKLKALLPLIDQIQAIAIEAVSSSPIGDVSIKDAFSGLPSKRIIGGTCANTWIQSPGDIVNSIVHDIEQAGGTDRLILSSGGEMPPQIAPELIRDTWLEIKHALM